MKTFGQGVYNTWRGLTGRYYDRLRGQPYFRSTIKNTKANSFIQSNEHSVGSYLLNSTVSHSSRWFLPRLIMGIALYRVHAAFAMVNIAVTFLPSLFSSFSPPSFSFFPLRLFLALSREDYPSGDLTQVVNTGSSSLFAFFPSFSRFLRECDSFFLFLQSFLAFF